jgi:hypothetical protein
MLIFPGQSGTVQLEWGMPGQGWRPSFESNPGNDSAALQLN